MDGKQTAWKNYNDLSSFWNKMLEIKVWGLVNHCLLHFHNLLLGSTTADVLGFLDISKKAKYSALMDELTFGAGFQNDAAQKVVY